MFSGNLFSVFAVYFKNKFFRSISGSQPLLSNGRSLCLILLTNPINPKWILIVNRLQTLRSSRANSWQELAIHCWLLLGMTWQVWWAWGYCVITSFFSACFWYAEWLPGSAEECQRKVGHGGLLRHLVRTLQDGRPCHRRNHIIIRIYSWFYCNRDSKNI